ncbi:hypothetical protein [Oceanobacillus sojae]|uniref:Uncharacterized protein n=1 Tax=Oceanobacillus sojae TaxID=582851 RepID=A0A511ZD12_9BACI|nr:hypothetical protein OSO01_00690 [Oceanobacillus sojae]
MNKNIYENLASDFKYKLNRELTQAEKEFFKWLARKYVSEQGKKE